MTVAVSTHELYAELGLSMESGRSFVRQAESKGLLSRQVRIGGAGGSSSWVELHVPVDRLSVLAESRRRTKAAAAQPPSPKDPRCKATCLRAQPPLWDHRCVGPAGHLGQHQFVQPCEEDKAGVHRPRQAAGRHMGNWSGRLPSRLTPVQYDAECPLCGKHLQGISSATDRIRRAVRQHARNCHPWLGDRECSLLLDRVAGGKPW